MKLTIKKAHIFTIILGAIFVSLSIFHTNLWFDESYSVAIARHSFSEIWRLIPYDYSPPFYAIALKVFVVIFGNSLIVMRCFSIIAVIGMYFIAAFPVKRIFGRNSAIAALLITFFSPPIFYQIHEIRPTIFAMFFFGFFMKKR